MKKIYLLAALLMGMCAFTACSDDDDEKTNDLLGTWELQYECFINSEGKVTDEATYEEGEDIYIFENNGKGIWESKVEVEEPEKIPFTYTYENNKLTIIIEYDGEKETEIFYVSIKDGIATAKTDPKEEENGDYYKMILKKIK